MDAQPNKDSGKLKIGRIWIPIILGLLAAYFMLDSNLGEEVARQNLQGEWYWQDNGDKHLELDELVHINSLPNGAINNSLRYEKTTNKALLSQTQFSFNMFVFLSIALLMVILRDLGYMLRLRILTDRKLTWKQCFNSIMLWEFSSAVTPSIVGGSGVAIYILSREGLSVGKSTATVMVTAMLDELFYIIMVPVVLIFIGIDDLFSVSMNKEILGITLNTQGIFWAGYIFILLLTLSITFGIFLFPHKLKTLLYHIFSFRLLKKWQRKAIKAGDDINTTSEHFKKKNWWFWLKSLFTTFLSWTSRYWVVNFLILAFGPLQEHWMVYGRQLVLWVIMLISPTPGGAGIAELAFKGFLEEYTPLGFAAVLAILWRLFTYYPYLFAGALILPKWLHSTGENEAVNEQ